MPTVPQDSEITKKKPLSKAARMKVSRNSRVFFMKLIGFLERIKQIPWFSVLLALMLGWGAYQIVTRPNSRDYRGQQWVQPMLVKARQLFTGHAKQTRTPPAQTTEYTSPSTSMVDISAYDEQLVLFEKNLGAMKNTIAQLQKTHIAFKKEIEEIHVQLDHLNQTVNAKLQSIEELSSDPVSTQEISTSSENRPSDYSVHATIPGRAWLNTADGEIVTVNVGSELSPFGIVKEIDTDNRLVYLDQGHVIGPSENDS